MQTINTNNEPIKVSGNFGTVAGAPLVMDRTHKQGGGASGNGLYSSLSGTPVDLMGDKSTIDIGVDRDDSGGGLPGDEPILPDIKPPQPVDPAIQTMQADQEQKRWGLILLALVVIAIVAYFLIKSTAK